uniref:Kinase n=1 Tax=Trepomonas sp. PC1 TaxID=1076344 RepID=A0A146KHI6_9EUKA|eukprot:JAP95598.1 Kinase [Trepomonas sp. PC1]
MLHSIVHQQNYLHLDIKPENILLLKYNDAILGDLGISQQIDEAQGYAYCEDGTLNFMAPEVMKGERITFACDIWSLGVVWYYILFDKLPYNLGQGDVDTYMIQKLEKAKINFNYQQQGKEFEILAQMTQSMLHLNPMQRPTIQQIIDKTQNKLTQILGSFLHIVTDLLI